MQRTNNIIFDISPMITHSGSGIGLYTRELLISLAKKNPSRQFICHYFLPLGKKLPNLPDLPNIIYRPSRILPQKLANYLRRIGINIPIEILAKSTAEYAFYPAYLTRGKVTKIKNVVTIHDLAYLSHKNTLATRNQRDLEVLVPQSISKAHLVLCISNETKKALQKNYKINKEKIAVFPVPPAEITIINNNDAKDYINKLVGSNKFFLFVGTIEPRKNINTLAEAFLMLSPTILKKRSLVIVGGRGWKDKDILNRIGELQKKCKNIITTGLVTEEEKSFLYSACDAFVSASHEEGFGIPILEAAQHGKPSLLSDIPVFHEVAGDSALYFNEKEPGDIARVMTEFVLSPKTKNTLSKKAKLNLKRFSWDRIADGLSSILKI